jgi:flagellar motility protein MotE (MotC chaperone)
MRGQARLRLPIILLLAFGAATSGGANEQPLMDSHPAETATGPESGGVAAAGGVDVKPDVSDGKDLFCASIVDEAREQRYFLIEKRLTLLLTEAEKRMITVKAKKSELEAWVLRREEFAKQANGRLVEIYAGMKPEASAARLEKIDPGLAASLLLAIQPRQAGVILNEMDEKIAADITAIMAAAARKKDPS